MEKIKLLRKQNNLTLKELAEKIGVAESTVSLYENGKREPSLDILKKIAKIFNVSTDYLLGNGQNNVEELLPKENTITVFGYGGKRRDYHLSEENAKLLEQLAEKMSKEKIDGDF